MVELSHGDSRTSVDALIVFDTNGLVPRSHKVGEYLLNRRTNRVMLQSRRKIAAWYWSAGNAQSEAWNPSDQTR